MLEAYSTVTHGTKTVDDCSFDGITYVFTLFYENERAGSFETHSPKPGAIEYDMAILFTQIANDLKSQSFDEEKYMPVLKSFWMAFSEPFTLSLFIESWFFWN